MYLDNVINYMKEYEEQVKGLEEVLKKTMKQIESDYGTSGRLYFEKREEAQKLYQTQKELLKSEGLKMVKDTFDNLNSMVDEFITAPVPEGFDNTLNAIKSVGKLTPEEAQAYMKKFQNNYLASRALLITLTNTGLKLNLTVENVQAIKNELESAREASRNFFIKYKLGSYQSALMLHEQSPLKAYDKNLEKFINETVYKSDFQN